MQGVKELKAIFPSLFRQLACHFTQKLSKRAAIIEITVPERLDKLGQHKHYILYLDGLEFSHCGSPNFAKVFATLLIRARQYAV